jgi:hypothetical protein
LQGTLLKKTPSFTALTSFPLVTSFALWPFKAIAASVYNPDIMVFDHTAPGWICPLSEKQLSEYLVGFDQNHKYWICSLQWYFDANSSPSYSRELVKFMTSFSISNRGEICKEIWKRSDPEQQVTLDDFVFMLNKLLVRQTNSPCISRLI